MRFATIDRGDRAVTVLERGGTLVDLDALGARRGTTVPVGRAFVAAWEAGDGALHALAAHARDASASSLPALDPAAIRWLPPVPDAGQVIAIGLNYRSHCQEQGREAPVEPLFFAKLAGALSGHGAPIVHWPLTAQLDYEGELAVVIGRGGRAIPEAQALDRCFGYTVLDDVTARDLQRSDRQWTRAKGMDGFAPCGPLVVTRDEVPDPQALRIRTWVNGQPVQDASTAEMTFTVARLVAYVSQAITLRPGDIITTGTPAGVGTFATPPHYLAPGDEVRVRIDGIGELVNRVVAP